ncbi:unnamed protein product, partial [Didymodactylos carnosus]
NKRRQDLLFENVVHTPVDSTPPAKLERSYALYKGRESPVPSITTNRLSQRN